MSVRDSPGRREECALQQTVPNHFVPSLVSFALRTGAAPEPLFSEIGRTLSAAREPGALFSVREVESLWEALCARIGDPGLALALGQQVDPERLGLFGLLLSTGASPRVSLTALSDYKGLLHPLLDVVCEERDDDTVLRYASRDGGPIGDKPYYAETLFSALVYAGEAFFGCQEPPRWVRFRHAAPSYLRAYERVFRCPLQFSQPVDELCYAGRFLDQPWRGGSASHHALCQQAERALSPRLEPSLVRQVQRVVRARMAEPELSLDDVARALAMSSRSLQRGLRAAGTSYRQLRDRVRHQQACRLLADPAWTTEGTAYSLGYRDRSNFVRAFERWSGQSPSDYRRARCG